MQQIVTLLVFQDATPRPVMDISAWIDRRFPETIEAVMERIEAQRHRRFLKAHLPADGLPLHDAVRYIHVARDGRDAAMSYHNHLLELAPEIIAHMDATGLADPAIGRTYPPPLADPAAHFHRWLTEGVAPGDTDGTPLMPFFHFEQSWWDERRRPNVLLVHYNDLKSDLGSEMQRIARFLGIEVAPARWPEFVEAAGFGAMRKNGAALMGKVGGTFREGGSGFFHRGSNDRWRGVFAEEDLARYDALVASRLTPDCARWLAGGRRGGELPGGRWQ
jgi:aryl sulfotransferase